jgi:hypothetical protein
MPYKIHAVEIDVDSFGAGSEVIIPDCMSEGIDNNPQLDAAIAAGEISPKHVSLVAQRAMGNFSTFALPTAIDATGLKALCIATVTEPGVTYYLQKHTDCGGVTSGSVHRSLKVSAGVVVPRRISCDHQGHATIDYDVVITKESGNDAVVISDTADMPTIGEDAGGRWTLGGCTIGGVALNDYTRLEIDLGNTVETRGTESDIWDVYVEVRTHAPTITISGIDPTWFKAASGVPISGLACTHANTSLYLRHRSADGTGFVANATATHIKFTAAGIATIQSVFSGQSTRFTETSVQITCLDDTTNDPIVVDTTSAIT